MKNILYVLLLLSLAFCEPKKLTSAIVIQTPTNELLPLKKGNQWSYKSANYQYPTIVKITEENINFNGKNYFKLETTENHESISTNSTRNFDLKSKDTAKFVKTEYIRSDENYYYAYDVLSDKEGIFLPKKIEQNQKWFSGDSIYKSTLVNTDSTLKTPTNKYYNLVCIKVNKYSADTNIKLLTFYAYYKKGLGLVGICYGVEEKVAPYYLDDVLIN